MEVTGFEYLGTQVVVTTRHRDLTDWLVEFLSPWFTIATAQSADAEVDVIAEAGRFEDVQRETHSSSPQPEICFLRDSHDRALPCWQGQDGRQIAYDETFRVFTVFDAKRGRIEIISASASRQLRVSVMRAIREVVLTELLRKKTPILHASALAGDSGGLAIIAPKSGGKTTLLIAGLVASECAFVTNDRLVVDHSMKDVCVRGFPTILSVRGGNPGFFPAWRADFEKHPFDHASSLDELRSWPEARSVDPGGNLNMSAAQFCAALGVPRQAETRLRAIVFPLIDPQEARSELRETDPDETAGLIAEGLFRSGLAPVSRTVFSDFLGNGPLVRADYQPFCEQLAKALPAYRFILGRDILRRPELAAERIARCQGH